MRAFDGFVKSRNNALAYWENLSEPLNLAQVSIYFFEVLLADAILVSKFQSKSLFVKMLTPPLMH